MTTGPPLPERAGRSRATVLRVQSLYYGITGLWPLAHMPSFEAITGPKTDDWLVHMVGLLTVVIAFVLWPRGDAEPKGILPTLAVGSAASYLLIDVIYSARRVISPIYLLDAVIEIGFIVTHSVRRSS
jgi:hypothetical protein